MAWRGMGMPWGMGMAWGVAWDTMNEIFTRFTVKQKYTLAGCLNQGQCGTGEREHAKQLAFRLTRPHQRKYRISINTNLRIKYRENLFWVHFLSQWRYKLQIAWM